MPANAFAVATTVGVVLGGPALFCVLIGKNPLPSTSIDTQVAAEPVLPVYAPPKPALAVVQEPAAEAQPIHVADGASAAAAPPIQVANGSADAASPIQVANGSADAAQPIQVVKKESLLKRSPFDDFELRIPVSDDEPAPAPKRSATKSSSVAKRLAPVYASSYRETNVRSPWNSIKAGARAYRQGMSTSGRFAAYGAYGSGQRFNPFTARFTRVNQRSYYRKWYQ